MQAALVNQFPFLLIDESQDTNKALIDAFFTLEELNHKHFALGLFGDMMQRIYADGQPSLGQSIPERWATPNKRMNHRSARRIVELGNAIRRNSDAVKQDQMARDDSDLGVVRLFVADTNTADRTKVESLARERMATICNDKLWSIDETPEQQVKTLTLEHHMAAARMGFEGIFGPLDKQSSLTTGLRDGTLAGLTFFSKLIQPIIEFQQQGSSYLVMSHLRSNKCLLLDAKKLQASENKKDPLKPVKDAVSSLIELDLYDPSVRFIDVLRLVAEHKLFNIPESLRPFAFQINDDTLEDRDKDDAKSVLTAWRDFLDAPYSEILPYSMYVANEGEFGTHQGVKGLEFERVLVILDDASSKGFLFNYEKVFGAKDLSANDKKKIESAEDNSIDRTIRLLYVTCTRAENSLALVAYTENQDAFITGAISRGWFQPEEIVRL